MLYYSMPALAAGFILDLYDRDPDGCIIRYVLIEI